MKREVEIAGARIARARSDAMDRAGGGFAGKTFEERRREALRSQPVIHCRVSGCPMTPRWSDELCPSHRSMLRKRGRLPASVYELPPKIEGRCNWPVRQGRDRCMSLRQEACPLHRSLGVAP